MEILTTLSLMMTIPSLMLGSLPILEMLSSSQMMLYDHDSDAIDLRRR